MASEPWDRIKALLADALEREPGDRAAYLNQTCADEPELRARVEKLLEFESPASSFLESPPWMDPASIGATPIDMPAPDQVGRYRIARSIAAGGAGTVYEAIQEQPHRRVALKLLRAGADSGALARRFERESQVLAQLHHPNIAHVYEAGVHGDGPWRVPYIAMELVPEARTIIAFAEERGLSVTERLELLVRVCRAVQHGHDRGIVHRDLKPANILVGEDGRPKVIDFGIARVISSGDEPDVTIQTEAGAVVGTLAYMSPEQCGGADTKIDHRADVYALGVVIFELLCGRLPLVLAGLSLDQAIQAIRTTPPARLAKIAPELGRDLDAITSRCLEKEPARRYPSAAALAADIRRHLDHQPVVARPPSVVYRAHLFTRRHRVMVVAVAIVMIALAGATIASTFFAVRANRSARAEAAERDTAEQIARQLEELISLPDPHAHGSNLTVLDLLDRMAARLESDEPKPPEIEAALRGAIGRTYLGLRRLDQAIVHLRRAVELKRSLDPMDPKLVDLLNNLGVALANRGDKADAESAYREALAIRRRYPEHDLELTNLLANLSEALMNQGKFEEAETLMREVLDLRRKRFGERNILVVVSLRQVALLRRLQGDLDVAEQVELEALSTAREFLDASHPVIAASLRDLGLVNARAGDVDDARRYYDEAWKLSRDTRSPGSADWNW